MTFRAIVGLAILSCAISGAISHVGIVALACESGSTVSTVPITLTPAAASQQQQQPRNLRLAGWAHLGSDSAPSKVISTPAADTLYMLSTQPHSSQRWCLVSARTAEA